MASRDRTTSPTPARWVVAVLCVAALAACTSSHPSSAGSTSALVSPAATSAASTGAAGATSAGAESASPVSPADSAAASSDLASSPASSPSPLIAVATSSPSPTASPTSKPTPKPAPAPAPAPTKSATPTSAAPTPLLVQQLADVGNAQQVVIVTSSSWSTDVATLQAFEKDAGTWHAVFPAMAANLGRDGFSADKHEGDLKTPAGKFGFGTMFGQQANPGVKFPYRVADSKSVWVDDTWSPYYNTWREDVPLKDGEDLAAANFKTAYAYAVDIAYNTSPVVPGNGSAIFLHVGNGRNSTADGTAGCVSIAQPNLLKVLRWLDPARSPIIVMAPTSAIRQY